MHACKTAACGARQARTGWGGAGEGGRHSHARAQRTRRRCSSGIAAAGALRAEQQRCAVAHLLAPSPRASRRAARTAPARAAAPGQQQRARCPAAAHTRAHAQGDRQTERRREKETRISTARQGQARGYATVSWSLATCNLGESGGAPGGAYPQCAVTTISACASGSAEGRPTMPSAIPRQGGVPLPG